MDMMLSPKRFIKIARKLHMNDVMGRKKITSLRGVRGRRPCDTAAEKGTFVIYTLDKARFLLPLSYLSSYIFQELLKMSEEEFGVSSKERIILPCDSLLMNYIVSLVNLGMSIDLEKAIVNSILRSSCSVSSHHGEQTSQHLAVYVNDTSKIETGFSFLMLSFR